MAHDFTATSDAQEPQISHYELLCTIGQGSFGEVRLGQHKLTGTAVAVKVIRTQQESSSRQERHLQEATCMAALHHPHVVQLFEVIVTENFLYLVMEHASRGDLRGHLRSHGGMLTETEARGIFRQLVLAVHHCHQMGIVHRDIKPSNVLLDADMTVKLADFGESAHFREKKLRAFCGNRYYAAPEMLLAQEYAGPPVDVWSLGVLLYRMVTGTLPFEAKYYTELKKLILSGTYTLPSQLSSHLQLFLPQLLARDPKARSCVEDLMPQPWLNMGEEELRPYDEPPSEDMDLSVTQEMLDMGFPLSRIEYALANNTYNFIMATYLMIKSKKPRVRYRTIRVRPYCDPDLQSPSPSPTGEVQPGDSRPQDAEQPPEAQEYGQKTTEAAGPAATPMSVTASTGPILVSRSVPPTPNRSLSILSIIQEECESTTATPPLILECQCGPEVPASRGPSPEPGTASRGPSPEPGTSSASARPSPEPGTASRGPSPEPGTASASARPSPEPGTASRGPSPEPGTASASARPSPEPGTASRGPSPEPGTSSASARPSPEPGTASRGPSPEPGTASASARPILVSRSAPPSPEPRTASARPILVSRSAPPSPEPRTASASARPSPEPRTASASARPSPAPQCGPGVPSPEPRTASASARPSPEPRTASASARPSPAPQYGPGVPVTSSSCSSGTQEGTSRGRRGAAERFLTFLSKLCFWPCKKRRKKRNKVMPS